MRTPFWIRRPLRALAVIICTVASSIGAAQAHPRTARMLPSVPSALPSYATVYSFAAGSDGDAPAAPLIGDGTGAFYGTTAFGGGSLNCFGGCGTVFKLAPTPLGYMETVLYAFQGGMDGDGPFAALLRDNAGDLFGTTEYGGGSSSDGTVFELTPSGDSYTERILYRFQGGSDGMAPQSELVADSAGALYGTTLLGGGASFCGSGCGTVYKLTPSQSGYTESVVYAFQSGSDGATPRAGLLPAGTSAFYGAAATGGTLTCGGAPINAGCGTIFKLTKSGSKYVFNVVYTFAGGTDAANPFATLIADASGTLYGTTQNGGAQNMGAVFKLKPSRSGYVETVLHAFAGGNDGALPLSALFEEGGMLYGTTQYGGGQRSAGVLFRVALGVSRLQEVVLHSFREGSFTTDGSYPSAGVVADSSGRLLGTTTFGGLASGQGGTVYRFTP